jgi:hypothetical protein
MDNYKKTKYLTDANNLRATLEKYGVAIIPNVINAEECDDMVNGMWNFLEHISSEWEIPIKRNDMASWKQYRNLFPLHSMLVQHWNIGHAQFIWNLRQNPKIIDIFSKLWNVEPDGLLSSFDGASFHIPPEMMGGKAGWFKNSWLHTDQSYTRNDFECVQSWITGYDVNRGDATLKFLESSNVYHKQFAEKFNKKDKIDWQKLNEEEINYYVNELNCKETLIRCSKGSVVFWDSRTIHCGVEPLKDRAEPNFRCIAYLCYMPRLLCSEQNIKKKIKAFEGLRTTSHWAHRCVMFPKYPRTYGKKILEIKQIDAPILSDIGKKLVGY